MEGSLVTSRLGRRLRWNDVYREAELYKAALRVYTKPLFHWRKALATSSDGHTLYDLAGRGLRGLDAIHQALAHHDFRFRPALALHYNFNGKHRTLYVSPWEERIVDLVLYRLLNQRLHAWFSPHSYAYRTRSFGLDRCQAGIADILRGPQPIYVLKRDISNYFASVNHEILIEQLGGLVDPDDYLFELLEQRVRFSYLEQGAEREAGVGIPFGSATACVLANVYLTQLDHELSSLPGISYFRYADDILLLSSDRKGLLDASHRLEENLAHLRLRTKATHQGDFVLSAECVSDAAFQWTPRFRHLGLEFRAGGGVALSRDKFRKICNLFRFAFRRNRSRLKKVLEPETRARLAVEIAARTVDAGVRNVAILDYYLKHVDDEEQLRRLDRWLAEEVLSVAFGGGHRKGYFRRIPFAALRAMGLPSLVHRRRLIRHQQVEAPFFIWKKQQRSRAFEGTVARRRARKGTAAFSPVPEAAAG
ncbi:MAG TPA: reverse transcriptase domain-containing protein [Terriglobales bacterium]|nr:reverse transcriptase domain-containing protein [Terriglobales bacterium]